MIVPEQTGPPALTSGARTLRTMLQVLVAVAAAVPAAAALLPGGADRYAGAIGVMGALVIIATATMNALESATGHTLLARPPRPIEPLADLEPLTAHPSTPGLPRRLEPGDHEA